MGANEGKPQTQQEKFEEALNVHGYAFQQAVIQKVTQLAGKHSYIRSWRFEAMELPVSTSGTNNTKIDIVLRRDVWQADADPLYMVGECKRVNPAYSDWFFARSSFANNSRQNTKSVYFYESLSCQTNPPSAVTIKQYTGLNNVYGIAIQVKADKKGDSNSPQSNNQNAIEDAATQVCKGLNGFVELLHQNSQNPNLLPKNKAVAILPVIFTTANLYVTETDLAMTDLASGNVRLLESAPVPVKWLAYQYHISAGLKHSLPSSSTFEPLGKIVDNNYVRTILVVNAAGVEEFLKWAVGLDFS